MSATQDAEVQRLTAERDEARAWVRRLTAAERVLTCVFCGHAYPPGTPDHGADVLAAHARSCAKHPMREAEARAERAEAQASNLAERGGQYRAALLEHGGQAGVKACCDIDGTVTIVFRPEIVAAKPARKSVNLELDGYINCVGEDFVDLSIDDCDSIELPVDEEQSRALECMDGANVIVCVEIEAKS